VRRRSPPRIGSCAAGSAALQADALDFFGDAANYTISLGVAGMTLSWRARAAAAKGGTLILFALWVLGSTAWHALHSTLPRAEIMGVVGIAALIANGGVALMPTVSAPATRICVRSGFARAMMPSAMRP
jgi:Co/Zn/Cd efflux system component